MVRSLCLVALTCALGMQANGAALRVGAAISLAESLAEIVQLYQKETSDQVSLNLASSNLIARQIEEGARMDLFFSADERTMDRLAQQNLIVKTSRANVLSNRLVVVVPADSTLALTKLRQLAEEKVKRIALGDPQGVPAGAYAKAWLEKGDVWEGVKSKVVPCENVRAALAVVESGNADAAIVYRTDVTATSRARMVPLPFQDQPRIVYPVAVVSDTKEKDAALRFLRFLQSDPARAIFQAKGFIPIPRE